MKTIFLFVEGLPIPQGSSSAFVSNSTGKVVTKYNNAAKVSAWRTDIRQAWATVHSGEPPDPHRGPVRMTVEFTLPRPKAHFNSKGDQKPNAPRVPTTKPDIDKLLRAVLDALTNHAYVDDSQVHHVRVEKFYANLRALPRANITIWQEDR